MPKNLDGCGSSGRRIGCSGSHGATFHGGAARGKSWQHSIPFASWASSCETASTPRLTGMRPQADLDAQQGDIDHPAAVSCPWKGLR
jgi:hypothetical protein